MSSSLSEGCSRKALAEGEIRVTSVGIAKALLCRLDSKGGGETTFCAARGGHYAACTRHSAACARHYFMLPALRHNKLAYSKKLSIENHTNKM